MGGAEWVADGCEFFRKLIIGAQFFFFSRWVGCGAHASSPHLTHPLNPHPQPVFLVVTKLRKQLAAPLEQTGANSSVNP